MPTVVSGFARRLREQQPKESRMNLVSDPRDWQPFTFRGVAALAMGPRRRLLKVHLLAVFWLVGAFAWLMATAWWPVVDAAAEQLPDHAVIRNQSLEWDGSLPFRLGENRFLAVTVDLEGHPTRTSTSDLQLELMRDGIRFHSLFGHLTLPYPPGYQVVLSRLEVQAWWGAWRWPMLAVVSVAAFVGLLIAWPLLATCYSLGVCFICRLSDRSAPPGVCWRLAVAALAPPVVLVGAALFLYGLQRLDLVSLLFALVVQIVVGWVYLLVSPFWLPPRSGPAPRTGNPFRY